MTHAFLKKKALELRAQRKSYAEIRMQVPVSKSTLSLWLRSMPLTRSEVNALRGHSQQRIERYRHTIAKRRHDRLESVRKSVVKDVGIISKRELQLIALALFWGEGTKSDNAAVVVTNSDPALIRLFFVWLQSVGIRKRDVRFRLHLYSDMDETEEVSFWSRYLRVDSKAFRKSYVKKNAKTTVRYNKGRFGHGTCDIVLGSRKLTDYVLESLNYLRSDVVFRHLMKYSSAHTHP